MDQAESLLLSSKIMRQRELPDFYATSKISNLILSLDLNVRDHFKCSVSFKNITMNNEDCPLDF